MHLLLIEDDAEAARFLAKGLRESGYVIDIASDGREGLFRATEGSYDLIVADRQLPYFDGLSGSVPISGKQECPLFLAGAMRRKARQGRTT